jgi:hypothetical protein
MLATGGSLLMALECCLAKGATIDRICVVNVMSAPEGIEKLHQSYPSLKIVTGEIDKGLNEKVCNMTRSSAISDSYLLCRNTLYQALGILATDFLILFDSVYLLVT